jgi:hypothetical protein
VPYPIDNALFQWEDGWRALRELDGDPRAQRRAEAAVGAVRDALRLRIGVTFSLAQLADQYGEGTDWGVAIANRVAPEVDGRAIVDAAFWQQRRGAADFAGGTRVAPDGSR